METQKRVNTGEYRPSSNDQVLDPMDTISEVWPGPPLHRHLHVFIGLSTPESGKCFIRPLFPCSEYLMSAFPQTLLVYLPALTHGTVIFALPLQRVSNLFPVVGLLVSALGSSCHHYADPYSIARAIPRWSTHLDNGQRPAKRSRVSEWMCTRNVSLDLINMFLCSVPFEMSESYDVANKLHKAMWRQDVGSKLQDIEGCNDLKYLPAAAVNDLGLRELGCFAEAILVREEYRSTFSALEQRRQRRGRSGGIVVTGHRGIGANVLLKDNLLTYS
jgi:hypothetical protein